ncbi:hypothetical protein J0910_21160 [Nocardiopsis sp. CNT-189]|uniref:hypothetical protein n=1 Tax=Nocardiopsis oceanisediminis TaxID=2816862 RepID=UPI003B2C3A02
MSERDPEWESERFGGGDPRVRRARGEEERLQADMGDDEQESDLSLWERYIDDPPEGEVDVVDDDSAGELGIDAELAQERRPGEQEDGYAEYAEEEEGPEDEAVHTTDRP